jgi:hypothetical protein
MDLVLVAFVCFALGAIVRTMYGFLAKILTTPENELKFDAKYWATLIVSIMTSLMASAGAFMVYPIPQGVPVIYIVLGSLSAGYALNDGINRTTSTILEVRKVSE